MLCVFQAAWEIAEKKPSTLWPEEGKVEIEKYRTRYREGMDLVLKGVSAYVEGGEKVSYNNVNNWNYSEELEEILM